MMLAGRASCRRTRRSHDVLKKDNVNTAKEEYQLLAIALLFDSREWAMERDETVHSTDRS